MSVLIIDFGAQYTQLIARKIRSMQVWCDIVPYDVDIEICKKYSAIILSGGPGSVNAQDAHFPNNEIFALEVPILGICYGMQLICKFFGGEVRTARDGGYGASVIVPISRDGKISALLCHDGYNMNRHLTVWMSRSDYVDTDGSCLHVTAIARDDQAKPAMIEHPHKKIYGVQFHPEVAHTEYGAQLLCNFVLEIAHCEQNYNQKDLCDKIYSEDKAICNVTQDDRTHVIAAVSGGVDSTVAAMLLNAKIGNRLICIFINTGLLRLNEEHQVMKRFDTLGLSVKYCDYSEDFLNALDEICAPEQKRKIIGEKFIECFEREKIQIEQDASITIDYLMQGTLYPDLVESGAVFSDAGNVIKSHHNVGGLPERMKLSLIEPLKYFFKDEVRELGKDLGIPEEMVMRHPFPGPGLAIRIPGVVTREKIKILQQIDDIYINALREYELYDQIWQAFSILLNDKSVGIAGDKRAYGYACVLRAVTSQDGMTANTYDFDWNILKKIGNQICNSVNEITRVLYDITSKPLGTIEWE